MQGEKYDEAVAVGGEPPIDPVGAEPPILEADAR